MLKKLYHNFLEIKRKKFVKDGAWLVASNLTMAVCGILINLVLTGKYGAEGFGIFSLGFKFYLVISLVGVFGCGVSVIKHIAQYKKDKQVMGSIVTSALLLGTISTLLICLLALICTPLISLVFPGLNEKVLYYFLPGLLFFTWNKVLLSVLNGLRLFKTLSIIQLVRWLLLFVTITLFAFVFETKVEETALTFAITEILLVPVCLYHSKAHFSFRQVKLKEWLSKHFSFGSKTMLSTATIDLYNSADVFMIGMFMNLKAVGIYTFASDIAKNLLALANIIQVNFEPIIAEFWHEGKKKELMTYFKRIRNNTYLIYLPVTLLAIAAYYVFVSLFLEANFLESFTPFLILAIGILMLSGYKPAYSFPSLSGFPGDNLLINIIVLTINIILNFVMLKLWGITGVALATASSYVLSVLLLIIFVKRRLSINLLH